MRNIRLILFAPLLTALMMVGACSDDDAWDELPSAISNFISEYFPGVGVSSYDEVGDSYRVQVRNSATLVFDNDYHWTEIAGNGVPLPEVLMYDQLPPALYNYIQGLEQQAEVYGVKRDKDSYTLTMHDTVITFDAGTGKISYPEPK